MTFYVWSIFYTVEFLPKFAQKLSDTHFVMNLIEKRSLLHFFDGFYKKGAVSKLTNCEIEQNHNPYIFERLDSNRLKHMDMPMSNIDLCSVKNRMIQNIVYYYY